jgi:hypothetical protein
MVSYVYRSLARRTGAVNRPERLGPGVPDLVFGLVRASVLVGGRFRLLNDPGTFWHLRLGRDILATGSLPRADTLTFTRAGAPWVDQSWLFDVGLAWVVGHGGWSAAALLSALGIAWVYAALARGLLLDGRSPLAVLAVALVAAGVGAIHFLVRPHLFTLAFVVLTIRACRAQHENGGGRVFLVVPLTALWANLHGGFLAGPLIVLTAAAGHAATGRTAWRGSVPFLVAGGLCLIAPLANPYGFGLYRHVGRLLVTSGVTDLIEEYQPIPFGKPDARAVEWVILGLVALPTVSAWRASRYELAHALVWLHLSLASVRHAPLFALAASPALARLIDGLTARSREVSPAVAAWSIWPVLGSAGLALACAFGVIFGGFDPAHWPLAALPTLNDAPRGARLFHEQDWGGLVESESSPQRRAYLDDRFELFGRAAILAYLNAIEGGPDWESLRDADSISLAWLRPERGLARRLAADPGWRERYRDRVSVLFERAEGEGARRSGSPIAAAGPPSTGRWTRAGR